MPQVNKSLYDAERWRQRVDSRTDRALRDMIRVYRLEDFYPEITEEDDAGEIQSHKLIMPHQQKFHDGISLNGKRAKYILHSGGVGSGKSLAATAQIVYALRRYPGIQIVGITGYDYYFDEFILPKWREIIADDDPFWTKVNIKNRSYEGINGSRIRFKAYDDPEKVKGWEAHWIWIEEASELGDGNSYKAKQIFDACLMRLRAKPEKIPRRVYVTQNPKGHNWVWKTFIKGNPHGDDGREVVIPPCPDYPKGLIFAEYEKVSPSGEVYYSIASGSDANKELPAGYIEGMLDNMADDPAIMERMVKGRFNPINTLCYEWPWFSRPTHVISLESLLQYYELDRSLEASIPRYWRLFVGIDVGGPRSPWAVELYVETPNDELICIGEYYKAGVTWDEVAAAILELVEGWENVQFWIDPYSAPQKQGPDQKSVMEEFTKQGINVQLPAGGNRIAGINHVRNLLKRDHSQPCPYLPDTYDDEAGCYDIGAARLYYLDGHCKFNLDEKDVWRFDAKKLREPKEHEEGLSAPVQEKPVDRDDHAQSAEIFAAIGWNPLPRTRTRSKRDPVTPDVRYKTRRMHR